MNLVMNVEPDPVGRLRPDCPEALEHMVQKSIAKDRARRYPGFDELLLDLAPIVAGLRAAWARDVLTEVSARMAKGDLHGARSCLQRVLDFDPAHAEAQSLRKEIQRRRDHPGTGLTVEVAAPGKFEVHGGATAVESGPNVVMNPQREAKRPVGRWIALSVGVLLVVIVAVVYFGGAKPGAATGNVEKMSPKEESIKADPKAGKTKVNPKDNLTYVWIEPGSFKMGCSPGDENARRTKSRRIRSL